MNKSKLIELIEVYGDLNFDLRANIRDNQCEQYDRISEEIKNVFDEIKKIINED